MNSRLDPELRKLNARVARYVQDMQVKIIREEQLGRAAENWEAKCRSTPREEWEEVPDYHDDPAFCLQAFQGVIDDDLLATVQWEPEDQLWTARILLHDTSVEDQLEFTAHDSDLGAALLAVAADVAEFRQTRALVDSD